MAEEKTELLAHIQKACLNFDDVEPVAFTKWEEMSIEELRTVAILLNDEMVMLLNAQEGARGHCYLLESLYEHITRNAFARNPLTGVQITDRQRQNINTAWLGLRRSTRLGVRSWSADPGIMDPRRTDFWPRDYGQRGSGQRGTIPGPIGPPGIEGPTIGRPGPDGQRGDNVAEDYLNLVAWVQIRHRQQIAEFDLALLSALTTSGLATLNTATVTGATTLNQ